MRIAINTRFLTSNHLEGLGRFTYETTKWMIENHPEHDYVLLFDRPILEQYKFNDKVKKIVVSPPARHPFLWYFWFEWQVPRILKKNKIDLFISPDGFMSLRSKVPTCITLHDLAFEHFPHHVPFWVRKYYKFFVPKYANKAKIVTTVSEASKKDIIEKYNLSNDKIKIVYSACPEDFKPLDIDAKNIIKDKYTDGCEYFIYVGSIHPRKNTLRILMAFEKFKKFYKSNMKMVIVGRKAWHSNDFERFINKYENKSDLIHLENISQEELVKLVASAYCSVYPSLLEGFGLPILEALASGVPIITSNISSMPEVAGEAALLVNPKDIDDIALKMGEIYKDEKLRENLIQNAPTEVSKYSWSNTAKLLYEAAISIF